MIKITAWLFVLIEIFFFGGGGSGTDIIKYLQLLNLTYSLLKMREMFAVYVPCKDFGFDFLICDCFFHNNIFLDI